MRAMGGAKANELTFQNDMLKHLLVSGWLRGTEKHYNRKPAKTLTA
jgi:type I restriction enzyme R subunit